MVEATFDAGDVVEPGCAFATIATVSDTDAPLTAFLDVNPADGMRIRAGMSAEINPSASRREQYGHILGRVERMSELPGNLKGTRRVLENDRLARDPIQAGLPFDACVSFLINLDTPSGYQWSSSRGPDAEVNAGMFLSARIIVDRVRLITLGIAQFDQELGMGSDDGVTKAGTDTVL